LYPFPYKFTIVIFPIAFMMDLRRGAQSLYTLPTNTIFSFLVACSGFQCNGS